MQLMTWPVGRLGSRFGLLFEPYRRRVMHSALGRFFDEPLDLAVGLVEPDGTERVLPFTRTGKPLYNCEQNARFNSITYRGYSEAANLRFELNFHSVFFPQHERMCLLPAIYVELRVTWAKQVRWRSRMVEPLDRVKLFIRLNRPGTTITSSEGRIDLSYNVPLEPRYVPSDDGSRGALGPSSKPSGKSPPIARVSERMVSLNPGARPVRDEHGGAGLELDLDVRGEGSGVKWRLVWGAHTSDKVLNVRGRRGEFRYVRYWPNLDAVLQYAIDHRDQNLLQSRQFEKLMEQGPLYRTHWHLIVLGFQSYLTNTWWCDLDDGSDWYSVMEGTSMYHGTVDVEYNVSLLYLSLWPALLGKQLEQWSCNATEHGESGGRIVNHDFGRGVSLNGPEYDHPMPVEENSNFLLLLQTYVHWTGEAALIDRHAKFVRRLADYLIWTDRDDSGFPSEGTANTIDDGTPAIQFSRKQTYLAIKRVAALEAAGDLLDRAGDHEPAERCRLIASEAALKIEQAAWREDHYIICTDHDATGVIDAWTGQPLPIGGLKGWDGYSLYTANGLLLPQMIGQPIAFTVDRLKRDMTHALRETMTHYGCSHCSGDTTNVWISQNLWRDHIARYFELRLTDCAPRYWDMLVMSNTGENSFGYIDTYVGNELAFYPRGATAFGFYLAGPRLVIDRLGGTYISVNPDRHKPQRWALLPLADWAANRVPICVVDADGDARIEGEIEPVKILGSPHVKADQNLIG